MVAACPPTVRCCRSFPIASPNSAGTTGCWTTYCPTWMRSGRVVWPRTTGSRDTRTSPSPGRACVPCRVWRPPNSPAWNAWSSSTPAPRNCGRPPPPAAATLNHNCIQVVGAGESEPRPHTDSRALCRYAAVLYLNPQAPKDCGTSFFRQSLPGGVLGGNMVTAPHNNLVEALGTRFVPPDSFTEDVRVAAPLQPAAALHRQHHAQRDRLLRQHHRRQADDRGLLLDGIGGEHRQSTTL